MKVKQTGKDDPRIDELYHLSPRYHNDVILLNYRKVKFYFFLFAKPAIKRLLDCHLIKILLE